MTKDIVKQGYEEAEKSLREKQVAEVKEIVLKTLERIREQEKIRDGAIDKIKLLKLDVDDIKEGKLDRIVERQTKDSKAKETSVVIIVKETIREVVNPWYVPYKIYWNTPNNAIWCTTSGYATLSNASSAYVGESTAMDITCSVAKDAAIGCYETSSGVVNLR